MGSVEGVIQTVRKAVTLRSKLAVASAAGLGDTVLRGVEDDAWNPTADTLTKLEPVALRIVAEAEQAKEGQS
jgi:hypothetical protein